MNLARKKRSAIWNFFSPLDDYKAMCNICKQAFTYRSSVSNLKKHLFRKHPSVKYSTETQLLLEPEIVIKPKPQTSIVSSTPIKIEEQKVTPHRSSQFHSTLAETPTEVSPVHTTHKVIKKIHPSMIEIETPIGPSEKKQMDDKLLCLFTQDFQPFSIVEDIGFRELCQQLNPDYVLPSRKTITNVLLTVKFLEIQKRAKEIVQGAESATLTTDCWLSSNNESFVAVTAHFINNEYDVKSVLLETKYFTQGHTNHNMAEDLMKTVVDWNLENKILLAVTDNSVNIKAVIVEELKWPHFGCFAHTLNSIVVDALNNVKALIDKTKEIVFHFKKSAALKNKLDYYQKQSGKEPKKLPQSLPTTWNAELNMLRRIVELQDEVRASLASGGRKEWVMLLTHEEFERMSQIIKVLGPLESATKAMSGEKYITASSIIIISNSLQEIYRQMSTDADFSEESKTIIAGISNELNSQLDSVESNSTLLMCTFLDPRYKNIGFSSETVAEQARNLTITCLTQSLEKSHNSSDDQAAARPKPQMNSTKDKYQSIWSSFDKRANAYQPAGTNKSRATTEVQRYLDEQLLNRNSCPVSWWKSNSYNYPHLSKIVLQKFGTVATSVPCERIFSKTGQLITDRRSRLTSKVNEIMFINGNTDL